MADSTERGRDVSSTPAPPASGTESGTTHEADFGKTDRYATKDDEEHFNVRNIGDDTAWDSGRGASIGHGTHSVTDTPSAAAEAPGVNTRREEDGD
jgi:hypothetical protein